VAAQNETVCDEPPPRVRIREFGDNSINLELLCWIRRPQERGQTVHFLALEIIKRFRAENIEIPFPQRDLHFKDAPPSSRVNSDTESLEIKSEPQQESS
jgi:small-conductance mechanosensitive channel